MLLRHGFPSLYVDAYQRRDLRQCVALASLTVELLTLALGSHMPAGQRWPVFSRISISAILPACQS